MSTCISSKKDFGVDVRVLDLAACGMLVILHEVQNLSTLGMMSTSSHNPSEFIVASTPSVLWNLEWITSDDIRFLFAFMSLSALLLFVVALLTFTVASSLATIAIDCNEVIGT